MKHVLSLAYCGAGLMFLGFTAYAGAYSSYYALIYTKNRPPLMSISASLSAMTLMALESQNLLKDGVKVLASGYGFATFCQFVACLLALSAAVIISPWITGTPQEKAILKSPKNYSN